jgi:hypothetical protein
MLFRDFNMIAAVAYAARFAAADNQPRDARLWDELTDDERNLFMQSALAVARGEDVVAGEVFQATAKAILDYNGGQGLLALEDLMNLGSTVMSLELLTEAEVAGTNIRESIVTLLHELAERRQGAELGLGDAEPGSSYHSDAKFRALRLLSRYFPDANVRDADLFTKFIQVEVEGATPKYDQESVDVLENACSAVASSKLLVASAANAIGLANDYWAWLHPEIVVATGETEQTEPQVEAVH